jgi:tetratricopeptide (TPR) repeat protein
MAQQTVVVDIALLGKMAGYIEMLVKDPYSTVFAALSDIYRTFGLHEEAVAVAQKGSEMLPFYAPGFVALGRALAEEGDPVAASYAYHQALALDPVNLAALTGLASSCLGCGQKEEALALLTQAQSISPDDEVVRQLFAVVTKLAALPPSASAPSVQSSLVPPHEMTKGVEEEPSDPVVGVTPLPSIATATLADIYIQQGFFERALKVFSDLLLEDPGNREIRRRYDELLQRFNGSVMTKPPEAVTVAPIESEPTRKTAVFLERTGKDALVALYSRWLDAINRRRADVY